jgi:hypothetical protein
LLLYTEKKMDSYSFRFKNVGFVVVSDDLSWAMTTFEGDDVHFLGHSK